MALPSSPAEAYLGEEIVPHPPRRKRMAGNPCYISTFRDGFGTAQGVKNAYSGERWLGGSTARESSSHETNARVTPEGMSMGRPSRRVVI